MWRKECEVDRGEYEEEEEEAWGGDRRYSTDCFELTSRVVSCRQKNRDKEYLNSAT